MSCLFGLAALVAAADPAARRSPSEAPAPRPGPVLILAPRVAGARDFEQPKVEPPPRGAPPRDTGHGIDPAR